MFEMISVLVKSRDEVEKLISDQIEAANQILRMEVQSKEVLDCGPFGGRGTYWSYNENQKEAFYNAYNTWNSYNIELFTRIFEHSKNTYRRDYENIGKALFISGHENYVEEKRKYIRNKTAFLQSFLNRLPLIPCNIEEVGNNKVKNISEKKAPRIFISHKTEDSDYAKAIIDMLIKLGVDHTDIFCSSVQGYGIALGNKIIDSLYDQFHDYKLFVIFIHSPRYYTSTISQNEMGAAWILRSEHRSFLTSDCSFSLLTGVINSNEIAFKAGDKSTEHLLYDFRKDIKDFFSLKEIPDAIWETTKKDFIDKVKSINYNKVVNNNVETIKDTAPKNEDGIDAKKTILNYMEQEEREVKLNEILSNTKLPMEILQNLMRQLMNDGLIVSIGSNRYLKYKINKLKI